MHFDRFLQQICPQAGLNWRKYRRRSSRRRIDSRLRELGLEGYQAYLDYLERHPGELAGLAELMRVTVSRFFRERRCWELLEGLILPRLLAAKTTGEPLRAWSAGSAGGEEPYSLALLWLEHWQAVNPGIGLEILATDIDETCLDRARRSLYRPSSLKELPADLRRHFTPLDGLLRLDAAARLAVRLHRHHLEQDPPPEGFDLVLCRYFVFTYFRGERRVAAARRLAGALRPGGVLMIGDKDDLGEAAPLFRPLPEGEGIFYTTVERK